MKTLIRVESYKVINAYIEHVKRLKVSGSKFKLIKPKHYFRYGYTVRSNESPRYSNHAGGIRD